MESFQNGRVTPLGLALGGEGPPQVFLEPTERKGHRREGSPQSPWESLNDIPTHVYHQLLVSDAIASISTPTFLLSQDIYSQMFTGPTPSPVSLLRGERKRHFIG